jgi:hypothetical protein
MYVNFKNTDIIVINAPEHDFPLFRKFLIDCHHLFNKVHYVYSYNSHVWATVKGGEYDYTQITEKTLPFANFLWSDHRHMIEHGRKDNKLTDFRDHAENVGLDASNSEAVLFIEPDIHLTDMDYLLNLPDTFDFVAHHVDQQLIMDPSWFWIKRDVIEKTQRWFTSTAEPLFSDMRYLKTDDDSMRKPWQDRVYASNTAHGGDHYRKFNSEVLGITTNAHLFTRHTYPQFRHYGGVIQTINLYRQNNYQCNGIVYHESVINEMIPLSLQCGVELDDRYVTEWTRHLSNIQQIKTNPSQHDA